ncbi:hypothetical protein GCM10011376_18400 [Nocardioides flavus (ex Wang et al. 2016)]|uniref:DUF6504 domain-containing protein n=1 Tax=Nocardioides flavus (ex Wang et al. 2016) TaxID=2058780 RepID=A0ABQ3HJY1_9ACTN|nr:DUF6504 family protein [Nocardioides flavus (ex Wang et al. 2016)]GHE17230.1 hypothetical protein GCM10011376_18400 [Nocardioides flavus (ex Wang et al. 2016)]
MQQYDDPVEVRRGEAEDPDQFLWRGRLWKVRAVLAHRVDTGRELWRVVAGRGPGTGRAVRPVAGDEQAMQGVFDLTFDGTDGRWQLVGCPD